MKTKNLIAEKISSLMYAASILIFIIAFNFSDNPPSGWTQQFFPDLHGRLISDVCFTDSLNGYATATDNNDPNYFLKTTDSGNNWMIVDSTQSYLTQIQFLNDSVGYAAGGYIWKTTNRGINWNPLPGIVGSEISVINEDTLFVARASAFDGGVFRSADGGNSWVRLFFQFMQNPKKIYMFNSEIGFITDGSSTYLKKTTNGGLNWVDNTGGGYLDIYFADNLTGWKSYGNFKKTTDGGLTWQIYPFPAGGVISSSGSDRIEVLNNDSIWSVGAIALYGNSNYRGLLNISTDGGISWGYQQPDTSIKIVQYKFINFANKNIGWAYFPLSGIHTTSGGSDTTIFVGLNNSNESLPEDFKLYQNYPNPFNPATTIKYELKKSAVVNLKVYNISGKEIENLINKQQKEGIYEIKFDAGSLSSGVYLYSLFINGQLVNSKKMIILK